MSSAQLLAVEDLRTWFPTDRGLVHAVDGVSFQLGPGDTLGIVGESGSGKSVLARTIMRLTPPHAWTQGEVTFQGRDLRSLPREDARSLWGRQISMVFQDPSTALNPVVRVGRAIMEVLQLHLGLSGEEARARAVELLRMVGISEPERRLRSYPHELSGGMRQRVCIALAIACSPRLLFADEPTTALDVTIQRQILDLLTSLQANEGMAMVLVSHDLGVVAGRTDRILVMYAGQVVESAPTAALFTQTRHPYTASLLAAIPRLEHPSHTPLTAIRGRPADLIDPKPGCRFAPRCRHAQPRCLHEDPPVSPSEAPGHAFRCFYPAGTVSGEAALIANLQAGRTAAGLDLSREARTLVAPGLRPAAKDGLLRIENLVVEYRTSGGQKVHAVSDVSLEVREGETLGLVGESGSGKSTTGRAILVLRRPTSGKVWFKNRDLTQTRAGELRTVRRALQMIFQDPVSSLNPRRKVHDIVAEGLAINRVPKPWDARIDEALHAVGLDAGRIGSRRPAELSGGQAQRVAIARALVLDPALIVCDEPVSALDVSVQAQVLNLLEDAKARYGLTLLFISHDLAVVKAISDRVAVMYLGKVCEVAPSGELYARPQHPYTQALLSAIPEPDPFATPRPMLASGDLPSPVDPPSGCRFRTRCPRAQERCAVEEPAIQPMGPDHLVACHFPG